MPLFPLFHPKLHGFLPETPVRSQNFMFMPISQSLQSSDAVPHKSLPPYLLAS